MNALKLIKDGISKGDMKLVAKGYKVITGEKIDPPVSNHEKVLQKIKKLVNGVDVVGDTIIDNSIPSYIVENFNDEETENKEETFTINDEENSDDSGIKVGVYDESKNDLVKPKKDKKPRKRKKKKLTIVKADDDE